MRRKRKTSKKLSAYSKARMLRVEPLEDRRLLSGTPGDYNADGLVDTADYTVWRDYLGSAVALPNEDPEATPGYVTWDDYTVWKSNYGLPKFDYSDAPEPYPVTLAENGARHNDAGPTLGATRDDEANGTHSADADADGTDEDGVTFGTIRPGQLNAAVIANVQNAPGGARLDAWMDFNGDGNWGGPGEQIAHSTPVVDGANTIEFDVPGWARPGSSFARFRISTDGSLGVRGTAPDGEVEDYQVTISPAVAADARFDTMHIMTSDSVSARGIHVVDLDNDGDVDALAALQDDGQTVWYENKGSGPFTRHKIYDHADTDAQTAQKVWAADINGDGHLDVLSASWWDATVTIHTNDGNQNWTHQSFSVPSARGVSAADIDDDGNIDVLAAASSNGRITWFDNNGDGTFHEQVVGQTPEINYAYAVHSSDLNRDGYLDILSATATDNQIAWFENNPTHSFQYHSISHDANFARDVFSADLDGDNDIDVMSANLMANTVSWYENHGNETFTTHVITDNEPSVTAVFATDIDGDSDMDILTANPEPGTISWHENDGSGNFTSHLIASDRPGSFTIMSIDMDNDGDLDVVSNSMSDGVIAWYENNATPTLDGVANLVIDEDAAQQMVALTGITAGGGESQPLSVTATSSDTNLIPDPLVNYPAADWLTDSLIAHYPFDGDATDQSGNGNDGTVTGPVLTADRFGFSQSAYRFDGVDDSITWSEAVADSWFEGRTELSLSLWIKPLVEESSTKKMFFEYGISIFGIEGRTGPDQTVDFWINDYAGADATLSTTLDVGQWNHLVLQIDGVHKQLYKNGVLAGNVAFSDAILGASSFYLGRRAGWSNSSTHSEFDDLRIYDRALTASEVSQLYTHTGTTGTLQFTPAANQTGTATITVTVEDGGADNNLATPADNATTSRTFAVATGLVNHAPTGVTLQNTTASLAENSDTSGRIKVADIVIADDALGTNTITLSGADAASFEVEGTELFLKAGVGLDYGLQSSYAVTVSVEDSSVAGSAPVTVDYTLPLVGDVEFGFTHINQAGAEDHLVDSTGMGKYFEWQNPPLTYWGPAANGVEGRLVYKFELPGQAQSIRLQAAASCWDFFNEPGGYGRGVSAIEVSKDGATWVALHDNVTPLAWGADWSVDDQLPAAVLGGNAIWVRMRFLVEGAPNSSYTVAQFGRSTAAAADNVFEIEATVIAD